MLQQQELVEIRAQIAEAFDIIETEQLTLGQISKRRLFPPFWIEALGVGRRRAAFGRVWWKRLRAYANGSTKPTQVHRTTTGGEVGKTLCGETIPYYDLTYEVNPLRDGKIIPECPACRQIAASWGYDV